jgi:hypothetical protein
MEYREGAGLESESRRLMLCVTEVGTSAVQSPPPIPSPSIPARPAPKKAGSRRQNPT